MTLVTRALFKESSQRVLPFQGIGVKYIIDGGNLLL